MYLHLWSTLKSLMTLLQSTVLSSPMSRSPLPEELQPQTPAQLYIPCSHEKQFPWWRIIPTTKLVLGSHKALWSCRNVQNRKFSVTSCRFWCIRELQFHTGAEFCLHKRGRRKAIHFQPLENSYGFTVLMKQGPHLVYVHTNEKGPDRISGELAEYPMWGDTFLSFRIYSVHSDAPRFWHSLNQNSQGIKISSHNSRIKDEH